VKGHPDPETAPLGPVLEDLAQRVARCFNREGLEQANRMLTAVETLYGTQQAVDVAIRAEDLAGVWEWEEQADLLRDMAEEDQRERRADRQQADREEWADRTDPGAIQ
jgi:hypothetical protein